MSATRISRREMLRGMGAVTAGAVLAACAAPTQPQPQTGDPSAGEVPEIYLWSNMIALTRPEGSDPAKLQAVQDYMIDQVGVKPIGIIPPTGAAGTERLNLMLAARDEQLDIFAGDWPTYREAVQPIHELLDQHGQNILATESELGWAGMKDSAGNTWGVPRLGLMGHTFYTWFRTDWMEQLGLPFNKAQMTWEDLENTITAFREFNPDSVVVTDSLANMRGCSVGAFTEHGYARWLDPTDNTVKPAELQPGFIDWVTKMNEWWNKGWFQRETFGVMDFEEVLRSGNLGVHIGWYSRITILGQRIMLQNVVPGMAFDFPDKLIGPQGLSSTNNASMTQAKMITRKARHPDAAIRFMNWQYDPGKDNVCTAVYGLPSTDWEWVDPNEKYFVRRLVQAAAGDPVYAGEYMCSTGLGTDVWYAPEDDEWRRHYLMIRDYALNYENGKTPFDYDVPYDNVVIRDRVPGWEDINRLIAEETIKFITGVRPLSEWDGFIQQLYQAGLDDWIAAYTEQYAAKHTA